MKKRKTHSFFFKFLSIYLLAWWKVHLEEGFKHQDLMKIIIFISRNIVIELAKYNLRWTAAHGILHHVNNYFTKIRQSKSSVKKCNIKYKVRTHKKITNLYLFLIQEICFLMPHLCKRQCDAYNHWLSTVNSYQMCAHSNSKNVLSTVANYEYVYS